MNLSFECLELNGKLLFVEYNFAFVTWTPAVSTAAKEPPSPPRQKREKLNKLHVPAGIWPRGQNPRRQPRIPNVYTCKDKEDLFKKKEICL